MTIHYHGTPITPTTALYELAGRCFCVSHAAPQDVQRCHNIGQSVMLDNGAFSAWLYNDAGYLEVWAITLPALLMFWGAMGGPR